MKMSHLYIIVSLYYGLDTIQELGWILTHEKGLNIFIVSLILLGIVKIGAWCLSVITAVLCTILMEILG
jgi:hypothetical protein